MRSEAGGQSRASGLGYPGRGGSETRGLSDRQQLDGVPARVKGGHALAREVVLRRRVDHLKPARTAGLDLLAELELDGLEGPDAARGEVRLEFRRRAPADRIDGAGVDTGCARRHVAALEQDDAAMGGEVIGGGGAGDAATDDENFRLDGCMSRHGVGIADAVTATFPT